MKQSIRESIEIPQGITCEYSEKTIFCKKDSLTLSRKIDIPKISLEIEGNSIILKSVKANKNERKIIGSYLKHIQNMFQGLNEKFIYKLEACNVHFPMMLKIERNKLVINNFLGEKTPRYAEVLPNVDVQIKGTSITITSHDKESAGQTMANFERATKVKGRDRRVFQDGIFLVSRPGDEK